MLTKRAPAQVLAGGLPHGAVTPVAGHSGDWKQEHGTSQVVHEGQVAPHVLRSLIFAGKEPDSDQTMPTSHQRRFSCRMYGVAGMTTASGYSTKWTSLKGVQKIFQERPELEVLEMREIGNNKGVAVAFRARSQPVTTPG